MRVRARVTVMVRVTGRGAVRVRQGLEQVGCLGGEAAVLRPCRPDLRRGGVPRLVACG